MGAGLAARAQRPAPACRGATLLELAAVLALAAVIVGGAMALSGTFGALLWPATESMRVRSAVDALARAATAWYRAEHCGVDATPVAMPVALAHEPIALGAPIVAPDACRVRAGRSGGDVRPTSCVARHVEPRLRSLLPVLTSTPLPQPASPTGTFSWEIVSRPLPRNPAPADWRWAPPLLRVYWHPPEHLGRRIEDSAQSLARELGAFCDDDGNADTAEDCDGTPPPRDTDLSGERFVFSARIDAAASETSQRRLLNWLAVHAVDCDADRPTPGRHYDPGDNVMDAFCDGAVDDERIDDDTVIDVDGDGCDDVRQRGPYDTKHPRHSGSSGPIRELPCRSPALLDRNEDGRLDFDATGDFVVNAADFHALGC